jgi:hypothetical protein
MVSRAYVSLKRESYRYFLQILGSKEVGDKLPAILDGLHSQVLGIRAAVVYVCHVFRLIACADSFCQRRCDVRHIKGGRSANHCHRWKPRQIAVWRISRLLKMLFIVLECSDTFCDKLAKYVFIFVAASFWFPGKSRKRAL